MLKTISKDKHRREDSNVKLNDVIPSNKPSAALPPEGWSSPPFDSIAVNKS
jgi:hypothetical protein